MGSIGPAEILVVLVLALVVLGPTRLPDAARSLGKALGEFRRVSAGLQAEVRDAFSEPQPTAAVPVIQGETAPAPTLPPLADGPTPAHLGALPDTVEAGPDVIVAMPDLPTPADLDPTVAAPVAAPPDLDPTVVAPVAVPAPAADLDPTVIEWQPVDGDPGASATETPPGEVTDGPVRPA